VIRVPFSTLRLVFPACRKNLLHVSPRVSGVGIPTKPGVTAEKKYGLKKRQVSDREQGILQSVICLLFCDQLGGCGGLLKHDIAGVTVG